MPLIPHSQCDSGFADFNAGYSKTLEDWGLFVDGINHVRETQGLHRTPRVPSAPRDGARREPLGVVGSIYESLGLSGFEDVRPRLETYLGSIAGYRKNRHDELTEPLRRRIAHDWGRSFDQWGYGR